MNPSSELPDRSERDREAQHQSEAIGNLFRLLQASVQSTQLKLGGQIVVPAQDIVGVVVSAKSDFDNGDVEESLQQLNQASDSFRHKIVRWEAEARTAQSRQSRLSVAQKRQLPAEVSNVRTTSRKAQLFFDRLLAAVGEWAATYGEISAPSDVPNATEAGDQVSQMYQQVAFVPTAEPQGRRAQMPTEGLTKMMVQQQFEELAKLLIKGPFRHLDLPLKTAVEAFNEMHYTTARTRLNEVHQLFRQALTVKKHANSDIVDQDFRTLIQGISRFEQVAKSQREAMRSDSATTVEIEQEPDEVEDLERLQELLSGSFEKVFPAGAPREHIADAKEQLTAIAATTSTALADHFRALRHAITCGGRDDAAETKECREILKRLLQRSPEEIHPGLEIHHEVEDLAPLFSNEPDEEGIVLSFDVSSTQLFTVNPIALEKIQKIQLKFRNQSPDAATVQFQLYNAADEAILSHAESLRLPRSEKLVKGGIASPVSKTNPRISDHHVQSVEFMNIPDDVEVVDLAFRSA